MVLLQYGGPQMYLMALFKYVGPQFQKCHYCSMADPECKNGTIAVRRSQNVKMALFSMVVLNAKWHYCSMAVLKMTLKIFVGLKLK